MNQRTLSELAELCDAELVGDGDRLVRGPAPLDRAGAGEISFLGHPKYRALLDETGASAVLVARDVTSAREGLALLRCDDPARAFDRVVRAFAGDARPQRSGVHPSAVVDPAAQLGEGVWVGPLCVVGAARLADGVQLEASITVGDGVAIGARTHVHAGVVLYPGVRIGAGCLVHGGAVLGADGFGFHATESGWDRIPQVGTVVLEDDVEIGANTTIDRARFGATRVGRGAKIGDLVHVAHNVVIGEGAMLVGQVGVAGSAEIGPGAVLGGQVGVSDHVRVGAGARVAAKGGVYRDVPDGADFFGFPAGPKVEMMRATGRIPRLPGLLDEVRELRRRVQELEAALDRRDDAREGGSG